MLKKEKKPIILFIDTSNYIISKGYGLIKYYKM